MMTLTDAEKLRLLMDATGEKLAAIDIKLATLTPQQWPQLIDEYWLKILGNPSDAQLSGTANESTQSLLQHLAEQFMNTHPEDAQRLTAGFTDFAGDDKRRAPPSIRTCLLIIILSLGVEFEISHQNDEFGFRLGYKNSDEVKTAILEAAQKVLSAPGVIKEWIDEQKSD